MGAATQRKNVMLTLGMFTVPVNVEGALEGTKEVSLNTLCTGRGEDHHGPAQTRQTLACPVCENSDRTSFTKGKEMSAGRFVVVDETALESMRLGDSDKNNLSIRTHPASDVARTLPGDKVYFLVPATPATAATYALVAALIESRPDLMFMTKWAVRTALAMYQLTTFEGRLCLRQVAWPGSVRALPDVPTVYDEAMLPLANQLADTLCAPYDASEYVDDRSKVLLEYLTTAEGVSGATVAEDDTPAVALPSMDLAEQLRQSIATAQAEKAPAEAEVTPIKAPRKRAATKKTATRRTVAKTA